MEKFIGRKEELAELNRLYNSDKPEFVAVYGRRRVGKTFLIKEMFKGNFAFYHSGLSPYDKQRKITMKDQLEAFYAALTQHGMEESQCPKTWAEAFALLGKLLDNLDDGNGRQIVFIDELPWMDTPRSKFLTAFEHFWNTWCVWRDRIMLIVCGSATSWMLDNLINNHGGLYGRLTWEIKLQPFTLAECKAFFEYKGIVISDYDIAESYMILGGIPYYLNYFQRGKSLAQNIDMLFFAKNAKLNLEFQRLFGSLFANPDDYMEVVRLLSKRNVGFTREEISQQLKITSGGTLTKILDTLSASNFIAAYTPFGKDRKEIRYRLDDSFCRFYLRFVDGKHINETAFWHKNHNLPAINAWRGIAFEQICFNQVAQIKKALGVVGVTSSESSWIVSDDDGKAIAQIDMLIIRDDRVVNLCEMKFLSSEFEPTQDDELKLRSRIAELQKHLSPKQSIHLTLITTYGLKINAHSGIFQNVVTLKEML